MSEQGLEEYYRLHFWGNRLYEEYARSVGENVQTVFLMRLLLDHEHGLGAAEEGAAAGVCQRALCDSLSVPKQTMSRILGGLESRDLIEHVASERDRREKLFSLTEAGRAFARGLVGRLESIEVESLRALDPDDFATFNRIGRRYLEAFAAQLATAAREEA